MATFDELAKGYAEEIALAASKDQIAKAAGLLKEASRVAKGSNVTAALISVNRSLESLVYAGTKDPLSETDKDQIAESTAEILGVPHPEKLRGTMKQASIDNAIVVVQDIENIINNIKKK